MREEMGLKKRLKVRERWTSGDMRWKTINVIMEI